MIDWLVLLTPLIMLPLVALLSFVGCGLNTAGAPLQPVRLQFGPGLMAQVDSLKVMFVFTRSGDQTPTLAAIETLQQTDIPSGGGSIDITDEFNLHKQPAGDLICTCNIIKAQTLESITKALGQKHKPDDGTSTLAFVLTSDGDTFVMSLAESEIVYTGGI